MESWDVIIIGAGPAGLTAGIYAARSGLKTLILEEKSPGGMAATSPWIENYPGFPEGITGTDLTEKMLVQCRRFGAEIRDFEGAVELHLDKDSRTVRTDSSEYETKAVIIASGSKHKVLGVPGEERLRGRGVSYCAICDGYFFKGKKILVAGGGNCAAISALFLHNLASEVYLAHRRDQLRAEEAYVKELKRKEVKLLWNTEVKEIRGDKMVESVILYDNKKEEIEELSVDGVFIFVGEAPNSEFAVKAGVSMDGKGYVLADSSQQTNIPGVYAAGDVTSCPVKQIGTAVGQAIIAATEAFGYVKRPYYYRPSKAQS